MLPLIDDSKPAQPMTDRPNWHAIFLYGGDTLTERLATLERAWMSLGVVSAEVEQGEPRMAARRRAHYWREDLREILHVWSDDLRREYPDHIADIWHRANPSPSSGSVSRTLAQLNERLTRAFGFGVPNNSGNPINVMRELSWLLAERSAFHVQPTSDPYSYGNRILAARARQQELLEKLLRDYALKHFQLPDG
jgi:hypothetical protein